jgi:signal recognition particle GTPase
MAISVNPTATSALSLDDFMGEVSRVPELGNIERLLSLAPALAALAQDRQLVARDFNKQIIRYLAGERMSAYTP